MKQSILPRGKMDCFASLAMTDYVFFRIMASRLYGPPPAADR
jgi:hypothetical protein